MRRIIIGIMGWLVLAAPAAAELAAGSPAPNWDLPGVDGSFHAFDKMEIQKAAVIVFWSNHSQPCSMAEHPLIDLAKEFAPKGFSFVAINSNDFFQDTAESFDAMKQRAATAQYPFPYLLDATQATAMAFDVRQTPTVFVVGPDRRVLYYGAIDPSPKRMNGTGGNDGLRAALEQVDAGQTVTQRMTPVQGVPLKRNVYFAPRPARGRPLAPHDIIPTLALMGTDGQIHEFNPRSPLPSMTLFIFFSHATEEGKAYEDRIEAIAKNAALQANARVVLINPNDPNADPADSFENMKTHAAEKHYSAAYLFDNTQRTARDFGVTVMPHAFLVDRLGTVFYAGAIDDNIDPKKVKTNYLRDALLSIPSGKPMPAAMTSAAGSNVRWRSGR